VAKTPAKITASVEDFARHGTLGPIALGVTRARVCELLGPPTCWGTEDSAESASIWLYGDVEIFFESGDGDGEIWLIHIHHWHNTKPWGGGRLAIDAWVIREGMLLNDLESALRQAAIAFETRPNAWNPGCVSVVTSAGVSFLVCVAPDEYETEDDYTPGLILFEKSASLRRPLPPDRAP
jgi:hypothetical protein